MNLLREFQRARVHWMQSSRGTFERNILSINHAFNLHVLYVLSDIQRTEVCLLKSEPDVADIELREAVDTNTSFSQLKVSFSSFRKMIYFFGDCRTWGG